jgi:cobalt-zinc-cadmium efflux system outer membrane protein
MDTRSTRLAAAAAACLFTWPGAAAAQPPASGTVSMEASIGAPADAAPIDLAAAIRLALGQPALRAAAHEAAAGDALAAQAGNYPNPALSWLREGQQAGGRTTTLQISQPIELGGKRQARIALARGEAALAHADLAARRRATRAEVIAAYYTLLIAQEQQRLAQALTGLARRSTDVAARRVAAGKVSPIDETRARLAESDAATGLMEAGAALAVARTRLGALIGRPAAAIALAPDRAEALPEPAPPALLEARSGEAGAIQRAGRQLAAQEAQAGVERAARVPDLTLTLGTQREDEPDLREPGRRQLVFGVSLPLPLFDRNQGRLAAALRRTDKARDELAAARIDTAAELAAASTRYATARTEAARLRDDVIPQAGSAYDLTLRGFEAGKFAFLDVLDAQRTWFQVQSRHAGALLAAWRAYADIERLAGADQPNE